MASKFTMQGGAGKTIPRKQYVVAIKDDESEGKLIAIGKRVEDSSAEYDHSTETIQDILGGTYSNMKDAIITQEFDGYPLDPGDKFQAKILQLHVIDHDVQTLANMELYRIHLYLQDGSQHAFCERYPNSMVEPTGLGGEGGGNLTQPINVTFGGMREQGYVTVAEDGSMTYTAGEPE